MNEREIAAMRTAERALAESLAFFKLRDEMNSRVHLAHVRYSPITESVENAHKVVMALLIDAGRTDIKEDQPDNSILAEAWNLIANVSGGDWSQQTKEWRDAAAKFRVRYHGWLKRPLA